MNHHTQNAVHDLAHKQGQSQRRRKSVKHVSSVKAFRDSITKTVGGELPPQTYKDPQFYTPTPAEVDQLKRDAGYPLLSDLSTAHMDAGKAEEFSAFVDALIAWKRATGHNPGLSLCISSRQYGVGKSHMAKAMAGSFASLLVPDGADIPPVYTSESVFFTARQAMGLFNRGVTEKGKSEMYTPFELLRNQKYRDPRSIRLLVIDDLGREGKLQFVEKGGQEKGVKDRYFSIVDWCEDKKISMLFTSNMVEDELKYFFNAATWDRLEGVMKFGTLEGFPSWRKKEGGR